MYKEEGFEKVYCSTLKRTRQTVQDFESLGFDIQALSGLDELSWGVIEGKERTVEVANEFDRVLGLWKEGKMDAKMVEGESPVEVWERAQKSIDQITSEINNGGKALICTHGRTMRVVLSELLGYGMQQMHLFPHHNTTLNVLSRQPNGRWVAEKFNDQSHLQ